MSYYQLCFSPTGGTRRVMEALGGPLGPEPRGIDLTDPRADFSRYAFGPKDLCLVAVPAYGGRVPAAALERLGRMSGGGARAVLLCVYGNRAFEDTLLELEDVLLGLGFRCAAAVAAVAEHSIARQFGSGRPDPQDQAELAGFGQSIRERLEGSASEAPVQVPGNRPYRDYAGAPMKPQAGRSCTQCGLCARECPVGAIPAEDPAVTGKTCISCMRCVSVCPTHARGLSRLMAAAAAQKLRKGCAERKQNELFLV